MAKKVSLLILGGTGIIGRELTTLALKKGFAVFVVSRGNKKATVDGVTLIHADVRNNDSFAMAVKDYTFDAAIDLVSFNAFQATSVMNILQNKTKQYMFVSSATIFEGVGGREKITEKSSLITSGWAYPLEKIQAEEAVKVAALKFGLSYTIVRPYITYSDQRISFGQWEGFSVANDILKNVPLVIGTGLEDALTTLTHSSDLAFAMVGLIGNKRALNEDFNITSDESMTWKQVFEVTGTILGVKPRFVRVSSAEIIKNFPHLRGKIEDRCAGRVFDNSKIKRAIPGFKASYSILEGYSEILTSKKTFSVSKVSYFNRGKLDRIIYKNSNTNDKRVVLATKESLSVRDLIKYQLGFSLLFSRLVSFSKSLLTSSHDYKLKSF